MTCQTKAWRLTPLCYSTRTGLIWGSRTMKTWPRWSILRLLTGNLGKPGTAAVDWADIGRLQSAAVSGATSASQCG